MPTFSNKLLEKIDATHLPSMPHVLLKLLEVCHAEDSTFEDLAKILNKDTALSAKIMSVVNSPIYGRAGKANSFEHNLVVLGMDAIKSIAISASIYHVFNQFSANAALDLKYFWRHSLTCATLAKMLAQKTAYGSPDEAYLSGMLHNVGQLVLWLNFPKEYASVVVAERDEAQLIALEEKHLGTTHSEVGAWLVNSWELQSFMSDAVLYHHDSLERVLDAHQLVKIIYVANAMSLDLLVEGGEASVIAQRVFGLGADDVGELSAKAHEKVKQVARSLDIEIDELPGEEATSEHDTTGERRKYRAHQVRASAASTQSDNVKKLQLAREVRDISLLGSARSAPAEMVDEDAVLTSIQQSMHLLFGVQGAFFFLYDAEYNLLYGKSGGESRYRLVNELMTALEPGKNIVADTLLQNLPKRVFLSPEGNQPILDEQLIRLIQKEGVMCLPLTVRGKRIGVIVIGIDKKQLPRLEKQTKLITMFVAQSAATIDDFRTRLSQINLIEAERRAISDVKARKVVHEVNNPLSVMKNYIKVLQLKMREEDPAQQDLGVISDEIDRVAEIVRSLTKAVESKGRDGDGVNINEVIADLVKLTQEVALKQSKIIIETRLGKDFPLMVTDRNKLKQVMMNLIKNATEAMPGGGKLILTTRDKLNVDGSEYVEIVVEDTGSGIPPEVMTHLFEPVTTTKGREHAGLGLAIVKNIVKELRGSISCRSNEAGTSFQILLPRILATEVTS
jgi:signal transduction histidine kinase/HD-like signal output (HDOD) protein